MASLAIAEFTNTEWAVVLPGAVVIAALSLWLSVIDFREHRLPNNIVGPLAIGVVVWLFLLGVVSDDGNRTVNAIGVGLAGVAIFFVLNLVAGIGMGDVKYAFPVTATLAWFGRSSMEVGIYAMVLSAGLVAVAAVVKHRDTKRRLAFGPYMAFGLICGMVRGIVG